MLFEGFKMRSLCLGDEKYNSSKMHENNVI